MQMRVFYSYGRLFVASWLFMGGVALQFVPSASAVAREGEHALGQRAHLVELGEERHLAPQDAHDVAARADRGEHRADPRAQRRRGVGGVRRREPRSPA